MSGLHLNQLAELNSDSGDSLPLIKTLLIMGHSVVLGILLMMVGIWVATRLRKNSPKPGLDPNNQMSEIVLGAGNYLFLTIGMTVVMVLVNNNLARAFAIGAAISLVRLRIKVDGKGQGTTLLMAVLVGMACGVDKVVMAWCLMITYTILQSVIVSYVCNWSKNNPKIVEPKMEQTTSAGLIGISQDIATSP
ncbi:MAG: hypothetical protein SGI74_03685 [Oligoflexia bacterium]|nr:hypothetical protein [Oligoflexia bacterium]